jgi:hypothetical protein
VIAPLDPSGTPGNSHQLDTSFELLVATLDFDANCATGIDSKDDDSLAPKRPRASLKLRMPDFANPTKGDRSATPG